MQSEHGFFKHKKVSLKTVLGIGGIVAAFILLIFLIIFVVSMIRTTSLPSIYKVMKDWNNQDYKAVYEKTGRILEKKPLDSQALMFRGFACYYLAMSQIEASLSESYIDEGIENLRNALESCDLGLRPRIAYVLGKAYYQKGAYYADLACQYLDEAYIAGFEADDLAEYRGLSYAALGDYEKSQECFTEALSVNSSDLLLFAIAQNYYNVENMDMSKQYLNQVITTTRDADMEIKARLLLAEIFVQGGDWSQAEAQYDIVLEKQPDNADAYYGYGLIYEGEGDTAKARSCWRKALSLNPAHEKTRMKLER